MLKNKRVLFIPVFLVLAAILVLGMKLAYPRHRLVAFVLLGLGWIPLLASYRINQRLLRVQRHKAKKKLRPFLPHGIVAVILLVAFYFTGTLFPVEKSPLTDLAPEELRQEIQTDLQSYLILRKTADDFVASFKANQLLERKIDELSRKERTSIRNLWRDGAMAFLEFDLLKGKYRGFHQIDFVAEPALHSDAFLVAYMAYIAQYNACLQIIELVGDNPFMETLLNEEGEGIPVDSYFFMKQRLTHPKVILRLNAGAAYYELIKNDATIDPAVIDDFKARRNTFFKGLGSHVDIFVDNPLAILERAAFETMLPVQKNVAVQMSYIRTTRRDYLITSELLAEQLQKLQPGDILIQRRNWHMTNIGIPGFWPHVALYIGTPQEFNTYFSELDFDPLERIKSRYPAVYRGMKETGDDGFPNRVIEAIRPGVVFQSLETSARCDYLGVIRPNLTKVEKYTAILSAFSHYGKDYDLNFDFTTDNALVCSELVYKAYKGSGKLPWMPEIINGRRLLPPNRLAEQAVAEMGRNKPFSFVLFLDAIEKSDTIVERDAAAFSASWKRPKWDVMQQ